MGFSFISIIISFVALFLSYQNYRARLSLKLLSKKSLVLENTGGVSAKNIKVKFWQTYSKKESQQISKMNDRGIQQFYFETALPGDRLGLIINNASFDSDFNLILMRIEYTNQYFCFLPIRDLAVLKIAVHDDMGFISEALTEDEQKLSKEKLKELSKENLKKPHEIKK